MDTTGLLYPFDPTGAAASNLVQNERQTINSPGIKHFYYIIPKAGPFYANEAFELELFPAGRPLVEGVDYYFGHHFLEATRSTGIPVYGSIGFYDHRLTGSVRMKYQNVGGTWTISEHKIAEILTNLSIDPRITTWEQVVDMPVHFPPTAHEHNIDDMVGMSAVRDTLGEIAAAILASQGEALNTHIADKTNPHQVNKEQVGLGLVPNNSWATEDAARAGTSTVGFMNPRLTQVAITALIRPLIENHINRTDNPHQVTKEQLGLGNVENLPRATREVAEGGTSDGHYLTPLSGRWLFAAQNALVDGHIRDQNNPHGTTAAQVGAYSTTQIDSMLSRYLLQTGTAANANRVFGMNLSELLANVSNVPMNNALKFNDMTLSEVSALILSGTAANATLFAGMSKAELDQSLELQISDKVDSAVIPPVNSVKRLIGEVPDPVPPGWEPSYDILELERSYTKIARVPVRMWGEDVPQDVVFAIAGGRGVASSARPGFSLVSLAFDRVIDANNEMTLENIAIMHVNAPAAADTFKLFYQRLTETETNDIGEQITQTYINIWLEDAKLRGPVMCLDYSGGNVEFLTGDFPEFEQDVFTVQPNGTAAVPAYRATDAVQTALNAAVARVTALETRATNNEGSLQAHVNATDLRFTQTNGRTTIVEGMFEDLLGHLRTAADEVKAL